MSRARHRARVVEAIVALLVAKAMRRLVPMRRWAPTLIGPAQVPSADHQEVENDGVLTLVDRQVKSAVLAGCGPAPFAFTCLDQAVAGSLMLRRRGVDAAVVIGLSEQNPFEESHAWLTGACDAVLLGDVQRDRYAPATVFRTMS